MNHWDRMMSTLMGGPSPERDSFKTERFVVLLNTHWKTLDDGWAIAARASARALSLGGIDVRLTSWMDNTVKLDPEVSEEVSQFTRRPSDWDLQIFSSTLGSAADMKAVLTNLKMNPQPQVYHCFFERQYIEPKLVETLNLLDGVWVQCSVNRDVLLRHGVKNVTLIYHPFFDDDPHLQIPPPKECRRFYWIGRFEPRKAPDNLLRAFMRAFRPGEAELTMKLSTLLHAHPYVSPTEVIEEQLGDNGWTKSNWREHIHLIEGCLTKKEMFDLHASNDVYVSASRGEGLELGGFAAKLAGRSLVMTDSGGPSDYINDGDILVTTKKLIPAPEEYRWGPGANYIDYDLNDLVGAFQTMRSATVRGSRLDDKFKAVNVGRCFREWVESVIQ